MINKKTIKKLAIDSFSKNSLNIPRVQRISALLKRNELKYYIKALKSLENKKTITLVVPDEEIESIQKVFDKLKKAYPDKKILVKVDPSLIAGIKIINDDLIYEVSIKQILEDLVEKL